MGEKTKVPYISETVEIDGIYYVEQRGTTERRRQTSKRVLYERRTQPDPRKTHGRFIDEEV
ncbi:hypothetical protein VHP8226_01955 [Vibrio hippocampi]|uniref:Uncharacterized protein n=1 Tax=Vibrio hippocampi TaxID=654686 RepID=A0ABN8DK75_9VIBR|nr:hypothetical protein VHP8226_01955 [Vibrio hippocampi]